MVSWGRIGLVVKVVDGERVEVCSQGGSGCLGCGAWVQFFAVCEVGGSEVRARSACEAARRAVSEVVS